MSRYGIAFVLAIMARILINQNDFPAAVVACILAALTSFGMLEDSPPEEEEEI